MYTPDPNDPNPFNPYKTSLYEALKAKVKRDREAERLSTEAEMLTNKTASESSQRVEETVETPAIQISIKKEVLENSAVLQYPIASRPRVKSNSTSPTILLPAASPTLAVNYGFTQDLAMR